MSEFLFSMPPMPHYIVCGEDTYTTGQQHPSRKNIGVFDLLVVTKGYLSIGEEHLKYKVSEGHGIILRPDLYHYSVAPCKVETHFYWLHFQSTGTWSEHEQNALQSIYQSTKPLSPYHSDEITKLRLPRHSIFSNPIDVYEKLRSLMLLAGQSSNYARIQEQIIFQQIIGVFQDEQFPRRHSSVSKVAEDAANYLQQHYTNPLSYEQLGEKLSFHPTYISRCMKQVFDCTPLEYLTRFRIEQAKLHLLNTDLSIGEIADRVGFTSQAYFTRSFTKFVKQPPLKFRKRYR